jgi:hypothetical protein
MIGERTNEGLEIRLVTGDPGRYFSAAFLAVWLCGWAFGETFAIWMLVKGAIALLTGMPPDPGRAPLQVTPAVLVGVFLLFWLSIWTLGGIAAIGELLRLLWGDDRILVASGRLTVTWLRGPFRSSRSFERDVIRRIVLSAPRDYLVLDTMTQHLELSRLGTRNQRMEAASALSTELRLVEAADAPRGALPDRWEEIVTPEGERALVPNLTTRRRQAQVASALAMLAAGATFVVAREIPRNSGLVATAAVAFAFTIALAAGAVWLARGRAEWCIGNGALTLRRRYGSTLRDLFEARRLYLSSSSDSDGDLWFQLFGVADLQTPAQPTPVLLSMGPPHSRVIVRLMNDASTVRDLAAWLAREARLEIEDHTTPEAQSIDLARLREALVQSGPFGKWASKVVDRLSEKREKTG